jgi:hypothetical protein
VTAKSLLIIGDAHAKPGVSMRRFDWLGAYILETRPDIIVDMGDWGDFESLSSYDKGKKSFEGRRYKKDVEAVCEARDLVQRHLHRVRKRYKPRKVSLGGNHDWARVERVGEEHPEFDGTVNVADQLHHEFGWELYPFLEPVDIAGFTFQHYFGSGLMQRPIGGENHAVTLLKTQFKSCVQGHTHLESSASRTRSDGQKIQAHIAGCYLDPNQHEKFAGRGNAMWDRGLKHLRGVENGCADHVEWLGIKTLQLQYGSKA